MWLKFRDKVTGTKLVLYQRQLKMTKHPSKNGVKFSSIIRNYNAVGFQDALARWFVGFCEPNLHGQQLEQRVAYLNIPFNAVNVYHRIKFTSYDPYIVEGSNTSVVDAIHVQPAQKDTKGRDVPARFDTALINDGTGQEIGVKGE